MARLTSCGGHRSPSVRPGRAILESEALPAHRFAPRSVLATDGRRGLALRGSGTRPCSSRCFPTARIRPRISSGWGWIRRWSPPRELRSTRRGAPPQRSGSSTSFSTPLHSTPRSSISSNRGVWWAWVTAACPGWRSCEPTTSSPTPRRQVTLPTPLSVECASSSPPGSGSSVLSHRSSPWSPWSALPCAGDACGRDDATRARRASQSSERSSGSAPWHSSGS